MVSLYEAKLEIKDNETVVEYIEDKVDDPILKQVYRQNRLDFERLYPEPARCVVCGCTCKAGVNFDQDDKPRLQMVFTFLEYWKELQEYVDLAKLPPHLRGIHEAQIHYSAAVKEHIRLMAHKPYKR